jgi:hypothetical protein
MGVGDMGKLEIRVSMVVVVTRRSRRSKEDDEDDEDGGSFDRCWLLIDVGTNQPNELWALRAGPPTFESLTPVRLAFIWSTHQDTFIH